MDLTTYLTLCIVVCSTLLVNCASPRPLDDYVIDQDIGIAKDSHRMDLLEKLLLRLMSAEDDDNKGRALDMEESSPLGQILEGRGHRSPFSPVSSSQHVRYALEAPLRITDLKRNFDRNGWGGGYGRK